MKKLNIANVNITTTTYQWDEQSEGAGVIPPGLASITETILRIHGANGDLAWVMDTAGDMEKQFQADWIGRLRPEAIRRILPILKDEEIGLGIDPIIQGLEQELENLEG